MAMLRRGKVIGALWAPRRIGYGATAKARKRGRMHQIHLIVAILFEVVATSLLKEANGFTKLWPTLGMIVCYAAAFYFLGLALKVVPVGLAYAIWSGLGIVLVAAIGYVLFGQKLDFWAVLGLGLILGGVVIINTLSRSVPH